MSEWWSYRLEDFLLFSPRVYWRMFELHNEAIWPLQFIALLFGAATLIWLFRPSLWSDRAISGGIAAAWLFVALSFLWTRYAAINWAAVYAVPIFAAEALMLAWIGAFRDRLQFRAAMTLRNAVGLALFLHALVLQPLLALLGHGTIRAAEIFGAAPDPTAIATLGLILMTQRRRETWMLMPIPLAWCIVSGMTLRTMEAWQGWVPLIAAGLAIALWSWPRRDSPRPGAEGRR